MHFKKCLYVLLFFLAAIATIGGIGYSVHYHQYAIALSILVLAVLALPTLKRMFDYFR